MVTKFLFEFAAYHGYTEKEIAAQRGANRASHRIAIDVLEPFPASYLGNGTGYGGHFYVAD